MLYLYLGKTWRVNLRAIESGIVGIRFNERYALHYDITLCIKTLQKCLGILLQFQCTTSLKMVNGKIWLT
jgi:hypothetical protein